MVPAGDEHPSDVCLQTLRRKYLTYVAEPRNKQRVEIRQARIEERKRTLEEMQEEIRSLYQRIDSLEDRIVTAPAASVPVVEAIETKESWFKKQWARLWTQYVQKLHSLGRWIVRRPT